MKLKDIASIVPKDEVAKIKATLLDEGAARLLRDWSAKLSEEEVGDMKAAVFMTATQQLALEIADHVDLALKPTEKEQRLEDIWVLARHQGMFDYYMDRDGRDTPHFWDAKAMTEEEAKACKAGPWKAEPFELPVIPQQIPGTVLGALMGSTAVDGQVDAKALMASMLMAMQDCDDADDLISAATGWAAKVGVTVPGSIGYTSDDELNTAALVEQGAVDGDEWDAK